MKKVIFLFLACIISLSWINAQDLVSGGSNSWIFHTPDDGRTNLYIAPKIGSDWDFSKQTLFKNDGTVEFSGKIRAPFIEGLSKFYKSLTSPGNADPILLSANSEWGIGEVPIITLGYEQGISSGTDMDTKIWSYARTPAESRNFIDIGRHRIDLSAQKIFINGDVGIGTTTPDAKLTVKGAIHTQEVRVDLLGAVAPDFVFEPTYHLRTLAETERYINEHKHLPEIPSAAEMEEKGIELKAMNLKLLQKIEELTLYLIEQQKLNEKLTKRIENLETTKN